MSSSELGEHTSAVEITNVSSHGIWMLVRGEELFLPYAEFPWFREQPLSAVLNVEEPTENHFHWPEIDVDLSREIIDHPERYPNKAKSISA